MTKVRLAQLLSPENRPADDSPRRYTEMVTPQGLREIASYAAGIGANQRLIVPADKSGTLGAPTSLVRDVHTAGLLVHVWTLRYEPTCPASGYDGDPIREHVQFSELGVEGGIRGDHGRAFEHGLAIVIQGASKPLDVFRMTPGRRTAVTRPR